MSFLTWLEKERRKTENARRRAALAMTAGIMFVIVIIWLTITFVWEDAKKGSAPAQSPFSIIKSFINGIKQQ